MKKKLTVILMLLFLINISVFSQKVKLLTTYEKNIENGTRYVAVLSDNSIWWFAPNRPWKKSSTVGLPKGYVVVQFQAYNKHIDNGTRYVATLSDGST